MSRDETPRLTPPVGPDDHVKGAENAAVTLVEYGDFQCPYCREAYPIVKVLQRRLGGRLRVGFRNFPLANLHPQAKPAAEAAESAGAQGRFWEMHDLLFENQERLDRGDLERYAEQAGLDLARFRSDLEAKRWEGRVREQFRSGVISGVNGTPTFFINARRHDGGYSLEELLAATTAEAATMGA